MTNGLSKLRDWLLTVFAIIMLAIEIVWLGARASVMTAMLAILAGPLAARFDAARHQHRRDD